MAKHRQRVPPSRKPVQFDLEEFLARGQAAQAAVHHALAAGDADSVVVNGRKVCHLTDAELDAGQLVPLMILLADMLSPHVSKRLRFLHRHKQNVREVTVQNAPDFDLVRLARVVRRLQLGDVSVIDIADNADRD